MRTHASRMGDTAVTRHPFVKWGQNETYVFLSVQLGDAEDVAVDITDESLTFAAVGNGAHGREQYRFRLDYYLPIVAKQSRYTVTGRAILIRLRKELKDAWPRLTVQSEKLPWTHLDFDLYQFDASDAEPSGDDAEGGVKVKVIRPTKEERELHNAEMRAIEMEEEWEAFLKVLKHPLTIYLLLFNLFQFAGFLSVFGSLVLVLLKVEGYVPRDWFESSISRLAVVQLLAFLEPLHVCLRWVRGGILASLLQVSGRALVLFLIVIPHKELHTDSSVFWLFFVWSAIEVQRYPFYICSLLGYKNGLLTYLRYTSWIPLYPIGFMCEGKLIVRALPWLTKSRRFSYSMPNALNMAFDFPMFLHTYLVGMIAVFYFLMRYMYAQRRRVLGPRPRVGADQMGFFSYIPFLRSMVGSKSSASTKPRASSGGRYDRLTGSPELRESY
ncbi:hypothetical protein CRM22_001351 [Opisthorchis felineus]|uniref:Very-long-chain (3R)-3-hydroxyacyl-CoA dehydratase n=2 Tax=Opisthorchis felineus TaxID=147828 RepID=A0A4S2MFA3_OPIFE|nr:hypothetical protein CRM22_001351 [Opisthorchis felineus]